MESGKFFEDTWLLIPNWKWLVLFGSIAVGVVLLPFVRRFVKWWKKSPQISRIHGSINSFLTLEVEGPFAWVFVAGLWLWTVDALQLPTKMDQTIGVLARLLLYFYLIRLIYLAAEAFGLWMNDVIKRTDNTLDDQLVPLATRALKVLVVVFGVLVALQSLNVNVVSLLAGLGLGGLALALAAQDTAANVFGSITILMDRPFKIGDTIKVGDTEGVVEEIGFRSTRLRTPYNSLVTMPNSVVAKEKIDNLTARPLKRNRYVLGLTYDATHEQIHHYMDQLKFYLHQNKEIDQTDIRVFLQNLGDFSVQILVQYFVPNLEPHEELQIQEDFLLAAKQLAQTSGVEFAFPTQTLLHKADSLPFRPTVSTKETSTNPS